MIIKWIVCEVSPNHKEAFSKAQMQWKDLSKVDGFIAQLGGWNIDKPNQACILALWQDKESLEKFMEQLHDDIVEQNQQSNTYESIDVHHFFSRIEMQGELQDFSQTILQAQIIRIADCYIQANRNQHFEEVQKRVWLPGMKACEGMLGGSFSQSNIDNLRYLVFTFWRSLRAHQLYKAQQLPELRKEADISSDLKAIDGKVIQIEDRWKVSKIETHTEL